MLSWCTNCGHKTFSGLQVGSPGRNSDSKPSHHLDLQDRHPDPVWWWSWWANTPCVGVPGWTVQHTTWGCTRLNCPTHHVGVYQAELSNTPRGGVPGWTVQHTTWGCTRLNCPTHHVGVYQAELSNTPHGGVPGWTVQHTMWGYTRLNCPKDPTVSFHFL